MSNSNAPLNRLPFSVYCRLSYICGFEDERAHCDRILSAHANGRICICILPVLEDGKHYYAQCNFKRDLAAQGELKFVDRFEKLCADRVLPRLARENSVEAYLFLTDATLQEFSSQPVHQAVRQKFEIVTDQESETK